MHSHYTAGNLGASERSEDQEGSSLMGGDQIPGALRDTPSLSNYPFIEITFLNRIARVFLDPLFPEPPARSKLVALKDMVGPRSQRQMIEHFAIHKDLLEQVLLIDTATNEVVWDDAGIQHFGAYFLAFTRLGSRIDGPDSLPDFLRSLPCQTSLFKRPLFTRKDRMFRIKKSTEYALARVDDLEFQKRRGNPFGLVCPMVDCSRPFKRSGDLSVHFSVETGHKAFKCPHCPASFRRRILLTHHAFQHHSKPKEQVQKVQVEGDSPPDILLRLGLKEMTRKFPDRLPSRCSGSSLSPVNRDTTTNILDHACGQMLPEVFDEISKKLLGIRSSTTCSCSPEMLPSRRSSEQAAIINHLTEFTPQQQVQVQSPPPASAPAPRAAVEVAPPTVVPPPPVGREKLFLQLRQIMKSKLAFKPDRLSFEHLNNQLASSTSRPNDLLAARLQVCMQIITTSRLVLDAA